MTATANSLGSPAQPGPVREPRPPAPIVAVCGLTGGAGTSTVAYLLARESAGLRSGPVLLAELDAASGGLAELAGVSSPMSLGELAAGAGRHGRPAGLPFATLAGGVRLLARSPRRPIDVEPVDVCNIVCEAGGLHALTIVDCGTFQTSGCGAVLEVASHIVWVAPSRPAVVDRVQAVLIGDDGIPAGGADELLAIVSGSKDASEPPARALREAAAARCRRLVFLPFDDALAAGHIEGIRPETSGAALAIARFVHLAEIAVVT
jgi:MinD-like ATPase involved in chromosome partitioning or flagellar assembly